MVAFISKAFCNELRYSPAFKFSDPFFTHSQPSDQPLKSPMWLRQFRNAERIDPEPNDLKAVRRVHPDIKHPTTPDFITIGSIPVVSEAFRQIMLGLEPDKHQFVPVALVDEKGLPLAGAYWLINVLQCCNAAIDREQIKKWCSEGHRIPEADPFWFKNKDGSIDLGGAVRFLDKSLIAGRHLWRPGTHASPHDLFVSDELLRRVKLAKLRKLRILPAVEISMATQ